MHEVISQCRLHLKWTLIQDKFPNWFCCDPQDVSCVVLWKVAETKEQMQCSVHLRDEAHASGSRDAMSPGLEKRR